jgi:hypothetical protein
MDRIERAVLAYDLNSYISINEFGEMASDDFFRKMDTNLIEQTTPEDLLIQKEYVWAEKWFFEELSEEAKQVLQLILDCPINLQKVVGIDPRRKRVSINKLIQYLYKHWEERKIVNRVMQEIAEFAINLERYA